MIISASRRTDIPAFYGDWFMNRLREGYVLVRNPMNHRQISRINMGPDAIDCIVFWTKDPSNIISHLDILDSYTIPYYFLFTINGYGSLLEPGLRHEDTIVEIFKKLSQRIGPERITWRYDPIVFTTIFDYRFHKKKFEHLAGKLKGYTHKCIISFITLYAKSRRKLKDINIATSENALKQELLSELSHISGKYNIYLYTCAEENDYSSLGIKHAACIDGILISGLIGREISFPKDNGQRKECRCVKSVDIGAYNSCRHHCRYCYANYSEKRVAENSLYHDPDSPLLIGTINEKDRIIEREYTYNSNTQGNLFR